MSILLFEVVALSLFSRLALEPKFKSFFYKHLEPLLACVCTAIAAEAREAAATLANLMWAPGIKQERLASRQPGLRLKRLRGLLAEVRWIEAKVNSNQFKIDLKAI